MPLLTTEAAKKIASEFNLDGVLIFGIGGDLQSSTWGVDHEHREALAAISDFAFETVGKHVKRHDCNTQGN